MRARWWILITVLVALSAAGGMYLIRTQPVLPGVAGCRTLSETTARIDCYGARIQAELGRSADVEDIRRAALRDADASTTRIEDSYECHQSWHVVGRDLARDDDRELPPSRLLDLGPQSSCAAGLGHGFIEAIVGASAERFQQALRACSSLEEVSPERTSCFHGIGHGVERRSTDRATERCADGPDDLAQADCLDGLFMERSIMERPESRAQGSDMCRAGKRGPATDPERYACGRYLMQVLVQIPDAKPDRVLSECLEQIPGDGGIGCAAGADLVAHELSGTPDLDICEPAQDRSDRLGSICVAAVVTTIKDEAEALRACTRTSGAQRDGCHLGLTRRHGVQACAELGGATEAACTRLKQACWPPVPWRDAASEAKCVEAAGKARGSKETIDI